jgi:hypothetical protein
LNDAQTLVFIIAALLSGGATLGNSNWGKWQAQTNSARQMQLVAKLTW